MLNYSWPQNGSACELTDHRWIAQWCHCPFTASQHMTEMDDNLLILSQDRHRTQRRLLRWLYILNVDPENRIWNWG